MVVALKLSSKGYYQGDPEKVLNARVDHVLSIVDYEKFIPAYQEAHYELNKEPM